MPDRGDAEGDGVFIVSLRSVAGRISKRVMDCYGKDSRLSGRELMSS